MTDERGFDTGIRCPNCEEATLLRSQKDKRSCPNCGYSEPHDPITHTTTKDQAHG